jgi:hypothetical protein
MLASTYMKVTDWLLFLYLFSPANYRIFDKETVHLYSYPYLHATKRKRFGFSLSENAQQNVLFLYTMIVAFGHVSLLFLSQFFVFRCIKKLLLFGCSLLNIDEEFR